MDAPPSGVAGLLGMSALAAAIVVALSAVYVVQLRRANRVAQKRAGRR